MFVSIVSYDMYRYRQRLSPVILVLLSIYMCVNYPLMSVLPQICLIAFSFAMSVYCCRINLLRAELLAMRDNTAEHDMLVAQNTRQLLENQDNMVLTATPVSYTHLDVYKRQMLSCPDRDLLQILHSDS